MSNDSHHHNNNNNNNNTDNNNSREQRFTYKLHPTTIVLRSQQLNLLESQQQAESMLHDGEEEANYSHHNHQQQQSGLAPNTGETIQKKDRLSLIPQYTIPAQLCMPKSDSTMIGNRTVLLSSDHPTLLPHTSTLSQHTSMAHLFQHSNNSNSGENNDADIQQEIEQHIHQQQQQQQNAFTGPFLLYRNADWQRLKRVKQLYFSLVLIDLLLLMYLYIGVPWIRALSNFTIEMPIFGIIINNDSGNGLKMGAKLGNLVAFLMCVAIHLIGGWAFWKRRVRLLTYFISLGLSWILIMSVVIAVSSFMGSASLIAIARLAWFAMIVYMAIKARNQMQVNWYMTNQF